MAAHIGSGAKVIFDGKFIGNATIAIGDSQFDISDAIITEGELVHKPDIGPGEIYRGATTTMELRLQLPPRVPDAPQEEPSSEVDLALPGRKIRIDELDE